MNKWKSFIKIIITVCFLLAVFSMSVSAEETNFLLEVVPIVSDNSVLVSVRYTGEDVHGGSFNIVYDSSKLQFLSVEEGKTLKGITHFINPEYGEGITRVNWICTTALPGEGVLLNIRLRILEGTFEKSDIGVDRLKIANGDGNAISAEYTIVYETPEHSTPSTNSKPDKNHSTDVRPDSGVSDEKKEAETLIEFADVKETDWFYQNVRYVVDNKLMNGVSDDKFAPDNTLTRAMLVTVLYRNEGEPATSKSKPFADVNMGAYYAAPVSWAKINGIVSGVTENEFVPDADITREQIAVIIYRYARYKGYDVSIEEDTDISAYSDVSDVSDYAIEAMRYVVRNGLFKGKTATTLNPMDNATRAEIATILQRFIEANR